LGLLLLFIHNKTLSITTIFIIGLSFANIFPLIFSILIDHMPGKSNELSGLMVMAIIGGAIMPLFMGIIADYSVSTSFLVPLVSLLFIVCTAFYTLRLRTAKA
jgi:FHS family L-fucose permease-like MFS transporter